MFVIIPSVMQLILNEYHHALSWMYICGCFALLNGPNREVLWIIPIFVVIFGFWHPGISKYGITPHCYAIILKRYHHALSWMFICGYFALSKCPNREVLWIIPIFLVIFGQNVRFWPPGDSMFVIIPSVVQLILNECHYALSWMYICGCFALLNGPNREVLWIIPIFGVIFG